MPDAVRVSCPTEQAAGLFYHWDPASSEFAWGVSPDEVITATRRPWRLADTWLQQWLLGQAPVTGSPYDGMRRLLPGQTLEVEPGRAPRITNAVGVEVWGPPDLAGPAAEQQFRDVFRAAVRDLAERADPLTTELSGGLDSTYLVATLAHVTGRPISAFVAVPDPSAELSAHPRNDIDARGAADLAGAVAGIRLETVVPDADESPLQTARRITTRGWWPAFGVGNLAWVEQIRDRAAAQASPFVWTGTHGNAAFSHDPRYAGGPIAALRRRRRAGSRRPSVLAGLLTQTPVGAPPTSRERYLTWLAGHSNAHAGLNHPASYAIPSVDPFRVKEVLDVAARMTPQAWRRPGMTRGFARTLGAGMIPDTIRRQQLRGVQGADVWHRMFRHPAQYREQAELLADTPAIADLVDQQALAALLATWSWRPDAPPPLPQTAVVNRVLAFGQFIRDSDERLGNLAATESPAG